MQSRRRIPLVRTTAGDCAELLDLKVLKSNVLLLKLEVLAFHSLEIPGPCLELVLELSNLGIICRPHLSHFPLHILDHQLLLLIVASAGPF